MKAKTVKAKTVIIAWAESAAAAAEGRLSRLAYGDGEARVYDQIEPGVACFGREQGKKRPVPFFTDAVEALSWCGEHPRQSCQIQVEGPRGARATGLVNGAREQRTSFEAEQDLCTR